MGIGVVLLIWAVVGVVLAGLGAAVLGSIAAYFTPGASQGRRKLILAASAFPLACLGWAGTVFIFQAIVNETLLHRDAGIGDGWKSPLPNDYAILMIDMTEQGFVYNPKTQPGASVGEQDDAIAGVRVLQVAGRYIFGGADSHWYERTENHSDQVDSYFLLDTQIGKQTRLPNYQALRAKARELGVSPNLEPIASVYHRYRYTWFDAFAAVLFVVPPLVSALLLLRWIFRLRRARYLALS